MKASERMAGDRYAEYLLEKGVEFGFCPGDDPPDFLVTVQEQRWAVEITELHDYLEDEGEKSAISVEARLFSLFNEIESRTAEARKRKYAVMLSGPFKRKLRNKILEAAVAHLTADREETLSVGDNSECEIRPLPGDGNKLSFIISVDGRARTPDGESIIADIRATVNYGLGRILAKKVPRLRALDGYHKKVLIIVGGSFFEEVDDIRDGLRMLEDQIQHIDEVFLAWNSDFMRVFPN